MRKLLFTLLMLSVFAVSAQLNAKIQVGVYIQPELTFHQNRISLNNNDSYLKSTFNIGIGSNIQYNISKNIFVNAGVGFISRKFNARVPLDRTKLPAPFTSFDKLLIIPSSFSYKTFQFPINIGYTFLQKKSYKAGLTIGASPNYLLKAAYKVGDKNYGKVFNKGYWNGISYNAGILADFAITKKIILTSVLDYSFKNNIKNDEYLDGFGDDAYALPYNFLRYSVGVKIPLSK